MLRILYLILFLSIISCDSEEVKREKRIEEINNKIVKFSDENHIDVKIDTLNLMYSIDFDVFSQQNPKLLIDDFDLNDIRYDSGSYYVHGESNGKNKYFYILKVTPKIIDFFKKWYNQKKCVIAISNVHFEKLQIQVSLTHKIEPYGEDDVEVFTNLDLSSHNGTHFLVTGKVDKVMAIN